MVATNLLIPLVVISLTHYSIFLNSIFLSPKFQILVLIYENQTQQLAMEILSSQVAQSREKLIINLDFELTSHKYIKSSTTINKYFVISVIQFSYENHMRLYNYIAKILPPNAHHLFITKSEQLNMTIVHKLLLKFSDIEHKMFTVTWLQVINDNILKLHYALVFKRPLQVATINPMNYINNMEPFFDLLYFDKCNNMEYAGILILASVKFPNLVHAKKYNKELNIFEFGYGGVEVNIATLIKRFLNATIYFYIVNDNKDIENITYAVDLIAPFGQREANARYLSSADYFLH